MQTETTRAQAMEKLQAVQQLIEDALGGLRVIPERGTFDASSVDYAVGKLNRARDETANARAFLSRLLTGET